MLSGWLAETLSCKSKLSGMSLLELFFECGKIRQA